MKIRLYTTSSCPFCIAAKNLLNDRGLSFEEIDLSDDIELRLKISTQYNWRTVPMIIMDDNFVGGFDELNALDKEEGLI
ncbi:glutaredoxin [bacterium]|nr:glutaredoxin [bacterium]MBT3850736.1 glutaredoxin [bacterium]MDG2445442.1 glutaredoxin domain-containing protein [Thermodesulfobacteriota bacterium]